MVQVILRKEKKQKKEKENKEIKILTERRPSSVIAYMGVQGAGTMPMYFNLSLLVLPFGNTVKISK